MMYDNQERRVDSEVDLARMGYSVYDARNRENRWENLKYKVTHLVSKKPPKDLVLTVLAAVAYQLHKKDGRTPQIQVNGRLNRPNGSPCSPSILWKCTRVFTLGGGFC